MEECAVEDEALATSDACASTPCQAANACQAVLEDMTPPEIDVRVEGARMRGTITDAETRVLDTTVARDGGEPEPLSLSADGGFDVAVPGQPGTYSFMIEAIDAAGNQATRTVTHRVTEEPVEPARPDVLRADFEIAGDLEVGAAVRLDASGTSAPSEASLRYLWDFGDGTRGSGARAVHIYDQAQTYVVTLTVLDVMTQTTSVHLDNITIGALEPPAELREGRLTFAVTDAETGRALSNVVLRAGASIVETDVGGVVSAEVLVPPTRQAWRVKREGYLPTVAAFELPGETVIARIPIALTPERPRMGGEISSLGGATLQIPQGAFDAPVTLLFEDAKEPPGSGDGFTREGAQVLVDVEGAVYIGWRSEGGEEVSASAPLDVTVPVSRLLEGNTVSVWRLDAQGRWVEVGTATSESTDAGLVARFETLEPGWYAVGPSVDVGARTLPVSCMRTEVETSVATPCTFVVKSDDLQGWTRRGAANDQTPTTLEGLPSGRLCVEAASGPGTCSGVVCVEGDAPAVVALMCFGEDATPLEPGGADVGLDMRTSDREQFRFEADAGQGLAVELLGATFFEANAILFGPDGTQIHTERLETPTRLGFGWELPVTGQYVLEIEATNNLRARLSVRLLQMMRAVANVEGILPNDSVQDYLYRADQAGELVNFAYHGKLRSGQPLIRTFGNDELEGSYQVSGPTSMFQDRDTGLVVLPEADYYLVRLESAFNVAPDEQSFTADFRRLPEPRSITTFDDGQTSTHNDRLEGFADRKLYRFKANQGDGLSVMLKQPSDPMQDAAHSVFVRIIPLEENEGLESLDDAIFEETRFLGYDAPLIQAHSWRSPATQDYLIEVGLYDFADLTETGWFDIEIHRIPTSSSLIVDPMMTCVGANARDIKAALLAIQDTGTVELCEGVHPSPEGLAVTANGVTIRGAGSDKTRLAPAYARYGSGRLDDGMLMVRGEDLTLEGVELARETLSGYTLGVGLSFIANDHDGDGLVLRDVVMVNNTASMLTTRGLAISYPSNAPASRPIRLEDVKLTGISIGVSVQSAPLEVRNLTLEDIESGISHTGSHVDIEGLTQTTGSNCVTTTLFGASATSSRLTSIDCTVSNNSTRPVRVTFDQASDTTQRTLHIEDLTLDALYGLELNHYDPNTTLIVRRNRISVNPAGAQSGLVLQAGSTGTSGVVVLENNVIRGYNRGIEIRNAENFAGVDILHNSLQGTTSRSNSTPIQVRTLSSSYSGSIPLRVLNNLLLQRTTDTTPAVDVASPSASPTLTVGGNLHVHQGPLYDSQWVLQAEAPDIFVSDARVMDPTLELAANSPGVDAVPCLAEVMEDILLGVRPMGMGCDVGAFEQ